MHPHFPPVQPHVHRTHAVAARTHPAWPHSALPTGPRWARAVCVCGWSECAESHRDARALARHHRRFAYGQPFYLSGWASRIGSRRLQADATGTHVDITGCRRAWAIADGIGDRPLSVYAAGCAATSSAYAAADRGARAGLLTAGTALGGHSDGDTVLVVATPRTDLGGAGWDIAWVGSCRAYEYRPDDGALVQLTTDHTQGQKLRDALASRYRDRPGELEKLAAASDHIVTSSVATAATTVGSVTTTGRRGRLLLTTDGIHGPVPHDTLRRITALQITPQACARLLTLAATHFGGTDNATAMIIDPGDIAARLGKQR
ncbi:hypothetical protein GCM10022222_84380 [Amycolatopsis ultiminotia]|uniref:PPM-type phosphatase domain-containing protein n=1 Tax=Amycolatopsis ultiminotia TaxID=543629 RepID=A0ABP6YSH2_9PSEU